LTREPENYKDIVDNFKNVLFTNDETIHENIILFPNKYKDIYPVLDDFFKIFIIGGNEIYKTYIPLCKTIWVTQIKEDHGCDLFFDYNLENNFNEEKVFENHEFKIYKYTKL
jgi:dihydrofolate reductase